MDDLERILAIILAIIGMILALVLGLMIGNALADGPKFCPVCGERYDKLVSYCKYDGTELIMKGEH